tara:strand:+ start:16409 stop:16888 length:480 start_codon:yes stop_codon:yes gene_type:complete
MKTRRKLNGIIITSLLIGASAIATEGSVAITNAPDASSPAETRIKTKTATQPVDAQAAEVTTEEQTTTISATDVEENAQGEMPKTVIHDAEKALSKAGYNIKNVDGNLDPEAEEAIKEFQRSNELVVTGRLNEETLDELDVDYEDALEEKAERREAMSE